jgi:hypothetical protein
VPTARCDGVITTDASGVPSCLDLASAPLAWVAVEPFSVESIESEVAGELFAMGFVLYGTAWAIGKGAAMLVNAIRML